MACLRMIRDLLAQAQPSQKPSVLFCVCLSHEASSQAWLGEWCCNRLQPPSCHSAIGRSGEQHSGVCVESQACHISPRVQVQMCTCGQALALSVEYLQNSEARQWQSLVCQCQMITHACPSGNSNRHKPQRKSQHPWPPACTP